MASSSSLVRVVLLGRFRLSPVSQNLHVANLAVKTVFGLLAGISRYIVEPGFQRVGLGCGGRNGDGI
jgi:hypothetical protein